MRTAFVETLTELARQDDRIFLLTADLGWSVLERFAEAHPRRFLNVGVAEQNMAGIATGLAQVGYVPFIYSIATFTSMRCFEQVRNGPILHQLPVRVIGVGGGFAYGHAGPTHHSLEDIALYRSNPAMTVIAPADPLQTKTVLKKTADHPGPIYLRVGKGGNAVVPGLDGRFSLGQPELLCSGVDILLLATGGIIHEALDASRQLKFAGISAAVAVLAHLPFSATEPLRNLVAKFSHVVTVEEGWATGGLGSLVAETIAEAGLTCRLSIQGVRQPFLSQSGSEAYLRGCHGLTGKHLADVALRMQWGERLRKAA